MKFYLIFLLFIGIAPLAFSQSKNNVSVQYGISSSTVDIHGAIGDYGYDSRGGTNFGLTYTRTLSKVISLETGVLFYNDKIRLNSIHGGIGDIQTDGAVKLVSIPVTVKFTFLKYFYGETGLSADFQTNYANDGIVDKQSGLGIEAGIGGKYTFNGITVFVNPYFRQFAASRFSNNLTEGGLRFGVGFNF